MNLFKRIKVALTIVRELKDARDIINSFHPSKSIITAIPADPNGKVVQIVITRQTADEILRELLDKLVYCDPNAEEAPEPAKSRREDLN